MTAVTASGKRPGGTRDRGRLARDLSRAVEGEVRFDPGSRALYAGDASIYRQVPTGVVIPRDGGDVMAALDVCRAHDVPVLARGCGTGLAGQSVNAAVVFDFSKYMNKIAGIDSRREPGAPRARPHRQRRREDSRPAAGWPVTPSTAGCGYHKSPPTST